MNGTRGARCKGALLAQYAHTNEEGGGFYLPFQTAAHEPLAVLDGATSPLGRRLHAKLIAMHAAKLRADWPRRRGLDARYAARTSDGDDEGGG